ncbi:MAG: hypothetical protein LBK73_07210 [Treponema sp.]|nr:hypothetical protein [Treponema sp.]
MASHCCGRLLIPYPSQSLKIIPRIGIIGIELQRFLSINPGVGVILPVSVGIRRYALVNGKYIDSVFRPHGKGTGAD